MALLLRLRAAAETGSNVNTIHCLNQYRACGLSRQLNQEWKDTDDA